MPDEHDPTRPDPASGAPDDHSGAGRPRRDDEEFPEHRSLQEMGTHGGPGEPRDPAAELVVPPGHGES